MPELLKHPWPWYVAGPLIGLVAPALFLLGNKSFGISANFRHACAACLPAGITFFRYDWKKVYTGNYSRGFHRYAMAAKPGADTGQSGTGSRAGDTRHQRLQPDSAERHLYFFFPVECTGFYHHGDRRLPGGLRLALCRWLYLGTRHYRTGHLAMAIAGGHLLFYGRRILNS
jgi:hypothetical protein